MKKFICLGLILSFIACQPTKPIDYAIVNGTIQNNTAKALTISNANYTYSKTLELDSTGVFTDTIKPVASGFYMLTINRTRFEVYLEPGFDLNISVDPTKIDKSVTIKGAGAAPNNVVLDEQKLSGKLKKYSNYRYTGTLTEADFLSKMDSVKQAKLAILDGASGLSEGFKKLQKQDIVYAWADQLNSFENIKQYVSKDKTYRVSNDFYNYKKNLANEDKSLNSSMAYIAYFSAKASKLTEDLYKKDSTIDYAQSYLNVINENIKNQELKNILLYRDAQYSITYAANFEKYYQAFKQGSTNKENNAKIDKIYQALKKVAKGNPSPEFVDYENFKGGTTSLSDFKGKFVYVDVWATWCGPCKAEIPFLKKIEKEYHKKNIAFVSISVDTKKAHSTWQKMIKDKKMGGTQLFSDNNWNSKFVTDYMIKGIPRFILIDPKGNIVSANAPRPSNNKLKTLLAEYKL